MAKPLCEPVSQAEVSIEFEAGVVQHDVDPGTGLAPALTQRGPKPVSVVAQDHGAHRSDLVGGLDLKVLYRVPAVGVEGRPE